MVIHFLDQFHDGNHITKCHGHDNVLSLCGRESSLSLEFGCPDDRATSIEYYPFTAQIGGAGVNVSNGCSPVPREISITIAFKSLFLVGLETNSQVTRFLEVSQQVQDCVAMWLPQVSGELGNLVHSIHDIWASGLSQVVQLAHNRAVVEIKIKRTWLGNPFRIPRNSAINLIPDLLNSGIFIGILFFRS